jgi:hypothetical protein
VLALPLFELSRHAWIVAHVPSDADYRAAASFIRGALAPRDLLSSAPAFIDPIVRLHVGDRIPLAMAGRSDDTAYERMWVVSIRDALPPDAPRGAPELERQFGGVRVLRFSLAKSPVLFDLVSAWSNAEASLTRADAQQICPLRSDGVPRGGGLGKGVLAPLRERFECDPQRPWLFVAPVVMEDLDNHPRYCVWQHPQGDEPITLRYNQVPLGNQLVFYGGLYYEHERMREGGLVEASISIAGAVRAKFTHRDGEGWKRLVVDTRDLSGQRVEMSIAVRARKPQQRSFCWAATTRLIEKEAP